MLPEHKTRKRLVSISKIKTKLHPRRDWPKLLLIAVAGPSALPCLQFFKVNKHLVLEITLNCLYLVFLRKDALWLTRARREEGAGPVKISGLPAAGAGFSLPPYSSCGGYTPQEHLCVLTDPGVGALPGSPPTPATTGNLHGGEEGWQISKRGKKRLLSFSSLTSNWNVSFPSPVNANSKPRYLQCPWLSPREITDIFMSHYYHCCYLKRLLTLVIASKLWQ